MTRIGIVLGLFGAALLSGLVLLMISQATVVPMISQGTGPEAVQVTSGGWLALIMSILSTSGFTVAGIVIALANRLGIQLPAESSTALVTEIVELTAAFTALISDQTNRAAQRRFFFALVDTSKLISGCQTSQEAGVIVIKYSGYADPVAPAKQGASQ